MEKYKIIPKERRTFASFEDTVGPDISKMLTRITTLKSELVTLITLHNDLMKKREGVATAAYEYLRSNLTEFNNDSNRKILMIGCETSLDSTEKEIQLRINELNQIDSIIHEHFKTPAP